MHAFEEAISATASKNAPWYVVPADNKWFTRLFVAAAIVTTVEELNLSFPKIDDKKKKEPPGGLRGRARRRTIISSNGGWCCSKVRIRAVERFHIEVRKCRQQFPFSAA
jgi:hypothetical protein